MADLAASLSATELRLLAAAWISCDTPPKPDYDVIAKICGYKNGGSAAVMYGGVKRKLVAAAKGMQDGGNGTNIDNTPKATPKKAAKPKRAAADTENEQPKKRGRKAKAKSPTPKPESEAEEAEQVVADEKDVVKEEIADRGMNENGSPGFFQDATDYP